MIDTFTIRCNILHLAFSGKLTNQFKEDGTAKDILDLICEKKPIVSVEDGPYTLPESWAWIRLKDLYKINPKVIADNDTAAAFISMERISGGFDRAFTFEIQKWERAAKNHTKFEDGDVAFAKITPCFENRKSFIAHDLPNGIGGGTTELIVLRQKEMLPQYTYYLVLDQRFISTGTASYKGVVGQQRVQSDVIKNYLVPVAPYSEQKRIVKKIEQVFSILDTIDELQAQYADNLTALKSKLIDAAIQGKLTKQLPEDGTAEELYQQIQEEKQRLIKEGKIKKQKPLPEISNNEMPFIIPENWKWVRLSELVLFENGDRSSEYPKERDYVNDGIPFFGAKDIIDSYLSFENVRYISKEKFEQLRRGKLLDWDIICLLRGSVGKCAVFRSNEKYKTGFICAQMVIIRCINKAIFHFLYTFLRSSFYIAAINKKTTGVAVSQLSAAELSRLIIPLPPLAEQKRIVQKLEEILPLCEKKK